MQRVRTTRRRLIHFAFLAAACLAQFGCGSGDGDPSSDDKNASADDAARAILRASMQAYESANWYRDEGRITATITTGESVERHEAPFSVVAARPNRFRLAIEEYRIACDGREATAKIVDASNNDYDGQILVRPIGAAASMEQMLADPAIMPLVDVSRFGRPTSLALFASKASREEFLHVDRVAATKTEEIDGRACDVLRLERKGGGESFASTLWIDQKSKLILRFEFPAITEETDQGKIVRRLVVDFQGATTQAPADGGAWSIERGEQSRLVRSFVPPPAELPAELLGAKLPAIKWPTLDGATPLAEGTGGKTTAILVAASGDSPSVAAVEEFVALARIMANEPKIAFYVVAVDEDRALALEMKNRLPADASALQMLVAPIPEADNALGIQAIPTAIVASPGGVIEFVQQGVHPSSPAELAKAVAYVKAGGSMHRQEVELYEGQRRTYTAKLRSAAAIAPATKPRQLLLSSLWKTSGEAAPVAAVVLERQDQAERIVAIDASGRRLVEFGADGAIVARHETGLPPGVVAGFLNSAVDGGGKRFFVVGGPLQSQVALLDEQFKRLFLYPDETRLSVGDARLVDLDGDGALELAVGFREFAGVHLVDLGGKRIWGNRALSNVVRLVEAPGRLLAVTDRGEATPIVADGRDLPKWPLPTGGATELVRAGVDEQGRCELGALALTVNGEWLFGAVLEGAPQMSWGVRLPDGMFDVRPSVVCWGTLVDHGAGQWVVGAGDGSIQIFAADGSIIDRFNYGRSIRGLAVTRFGKFPAIVVASDAGIEAIGVDVQTR